MLPATVTSKEIIVPVTIGIVALSINAAVFFRAELIVVQSMPG